MIQPDLELAMRTLAEAPANSPLPDADLVWQRAAVRARWEQYERATRSIRIAEGAAGIVCAATGMLALLALAPGVAAALRATDPTLLRLGAMAFGIAAVATAVLVKTLMAEE